MISVAYALLLVSFAFGNVPEAWAAPIGTRNVNVQSMRRMTTEREHMRRVHHSATSVVQRDDIPVATIVAREADPVSIAAAREPTPSVNPISVIAPNTPPSPGPLNVVARHEGHHHHHDQSESPSPTEPKRITRRHHAKNEARDVASAPRVLPRFKRDEAGRRSVSKDKILEKEKRKSDATDANVARESSQVIQMKRESKTENMQKEPEPEPVRPIAMFRRAFAFENLD